MFSSIAWRRITRAAAVGFLFGWAQSALCAPGPEELKNKVKRIVEDQVKFLVNPDYENADSNRAPGGIVGVYVKGETFYFPYGRIDQQKNPPTKDTIFGLGSVTKTFTTSILGQSPELFQKAVTAGPLPPGYRLQPAEANVTFEELATFTGGIPRLPNNCGLAGLPPCGQELFVAFINGVTPPGGKLPAPNLYSNAGIGFLGQILMSRDGFTSFGPEQADEWYHRHLFAFLGMEHTRYPPKKDAEHPLSEAYSYGGGAYRTTQYAPWVPWGTAGRVFSTASDMVRFIKGNVGVTTIEGHEVPPIVLDGMKQALLPRTAMTRESPLRQGFAWVVWPEALPVPSQIMGKDGGIDGVSAYVAVNPDLKYGVVVLLNMEGVREIEQRTIDVMNALQALAMEE
jgi:beta-lactamase class C